MEQLTEPPANWRIQTPTESEASDDAIECSVSPSVKDRDGAVYKCSKPATQATEEPSVDQDRVRFEKQHVRVQFYAAEIERARHPSRGDALQ